MVRIRDGSSRSFGTVGLATLFIAAVGVAVAMLPTPLASSAPSTRSAFDIPRPDYTGKLLGTRNGRVAFRVVRDRGRRESVRFQPIHLELGCDDGSTRLRTVNIRKAEFTGRAVFEALIARIGGVYRIHGELRPRGRARGFIVNYEDQPDPPGSTSGEQECTTRGKQRWTANAVPGSRESPDGRPPTGDRGASGTYAGVVGGSAESHLRLRLRVGHGHPDGGRFAASGLSFFCDGDEEFGLHTRDLAAIAIRFSGRRTFFGDRIIRGDHQVITRYSVVIGRVASRGRALGRVYGFENPIDPAPLSVEPECSSWPLGPWHAERRSD